MDALGPFIEQGLLLAIQALKDLGTWFSDVSATVSNFSDTLMAAFNDGGYEAVGQLLLDQLESGFGELRTWVNDAIVTPLIETLTTTNWDEVGQTALNILAGIAKGLWGLELWFLSNVTVPIINAAVNADWGAIAQTGLNILIKFAEGLGDLNNWAVENIVMPVANALVEQAGQLFESAKSLGAQILNGIVDALSELPGTVIDLINAAIPNEINFGKVDLGGILGSYDLGSIDIPDNPIPRAAGGAVSANTAYLVGERGPELFVPGVGGSIVSNRQLAGASGVTITGPINIYGVQNIADLRRELLQESRRHNAKATL
jgi:hypothetical protein